MRLTAIIKACTYVAGVALLALLLTMCSFDFSGTTGRSKAAAADRDQAAPRVLFAETIGSLPLGGASAHCGADSGCVPRGNR